MASVIKNIKNLCEAYNIETKDIFVYGETIYVVIKKYKKIDLFNIRLNKSIKHIKESYIMGLDYIFVKVLNE